MTHEEILQKAQEKAIANGYKGYTMPTATADHEQDMAKAALLTKLMQKDFAPIMIFNHDFARAFWGEKPTSTVLYNSPHVVTGPAWKMALQQMVLEEDPIKYLEQFL